MRPTSSIQILAVAAALPVLFGCGGGDREGDETVDVEVTADQELAMCDDLTASVSTGQIPKTAGATMDSCGAIDAQPGRKTVEFVDFEGQNGGYLRLTVSPEAEPPVFLLMSKEVPLEVVREDGEEVDFLEEGDSSDLCEEAGGRYLWVVAESANYLRFGPTEFTTLQFVIEPVDTVDPAGE